MNPNLSTVITIASLALALFIGQRWMPERAENSRLRTEVAMLKRRLKHRGD